MSSYLTEEEQIEAFKRWWAKYGTYTVAGVVLFLVGYWGINFYEDNKDKKSQRASTVYEQFVDLMGASEESPLDEEQKVKASDIVSQLSAEYPGFAYVDLANLQLAKLAVEDKKLEKALEYLDKVSSQTKIVSLKQLTDLRKAKVLFAQDKYEEALALLTIEADSKFEPAYYELKGDIYFAQGKMGEAETAYNKALSVSGGAASSFGGNGFLQYKLDNSKVASQVNPINVEVPINNPHAVPPANPHADTSGDS